MTRDQIEKRLQALNQYELAIMRNSLDSGNDPEAIDRELLWIINTRSKLTTMLQESPQ